MMRTKKDKATELNDAARNRCKGENKLLSEAMVMQRKRLKVEKSNRVAYSSGIDGAF
jgi:hypothetical protein